MSRLLLSEATSEPTPPSEGQVALIFVKGTLYAWVGGNEDPTPITGGGRPVGSVFLWTAQFSGTLSPTQGSFDKILPPPYPIAFPESQGATISAGILAFAVQVESNTLNAAVTVRPAGTLESIEIAAGDTGIFTSGVSDSRRLETGDLVYFSVGSKNATTGSITLSATVTFGGSVSQVLPPQEK